jgi:thiol-disulfide isomerase/thioredoxin
MDRENKKNLNDKIDSPKKLARLIKDNTCVVIKLSASWCGPCKNKSFLESYHKLKDNYSGTTMVKFIELDIDNDLDIIEDKNYYDIEVKVVPTFFISKNGNFTKKFEGLEHLQTINKYLYDSTQVNN